MRSSLRNALGSSCCLILLITAASDVDARRGRRRDRARAPTRLRPAPKAPPARPALSPKKAQAAALLTRGLSKLHRGFYYEAIEDFKKGLALYDSPSFYYNMGLAYQELRKYVPALVAFERYGSKVINRKTNYAKLAREWIKILRLRIATVQVSVNVPGARVTVGGRVAGTSPKLRAIRIQPEKSTLYDIKVYKPGYETETGKDRQVRLEPGKTLRVKVKLITLAEATRRRQEYQREVRQRRRIQQRLRKARAAVLRAKARRRAQIRYAGWGLVVTGAAIAVLGGALGIVSLADNKYIEDSPYSSDYDKYAKRYERSILFSKLAWAGLGAGAAIATAGSIIVWWIKRRRETAHPQPGTPPVTKPSVRLQPNFGLSSAGLSIRIQY